MSRLAKRILIVLGILAVLLFGLHLFLTYRTKSILVRVVHTITNNKYEMEVEDARLSYFPLGIQLRNVALAPADSNLRAASFASDFVHMKMRSITGLFFTKRLNVEYLQVYRPSLVMYARQKQENKKELSESIRDIQQNLFRILNEMDVGEAHINDAAVKIFSARNDGNFFSINNVNVNLKNVVVKENTTADNTTMKGSFELVLNKPDIHLLDSTITVKLGRLRAGSSGFALDIDSLYFRHREAGREIDDEIQFSRLLLKNLHWQRFLDEAVFEIDTVRVARGSAAISILPDATKAPKADSARSYNGNGFIVHYLLISDIDYAVQAATKVRGNKAEMVMNLRGDSLRLKGLSVMPGRKPAIDVEELGIRIRDFYEGDADNTFSFSLSDIAISNKQLILRNYEMRTAQNDARRKVNHLVVPELRMENYLLDELLRKRLIASKLIVNDPLLVYTPRYKGERKRAEGTVDEAIADIMSSLQQRVFIDQIEINNATATVIPPLRPNDRVAVTNLNFSIDGGRALRSRSLIEVIESLTRFNSRGFRLESKGMNLHLSQVALLPSHKGLKAGRVQGRLSNGTTLDLYGVTLLGEENIVDLTKPENLLAELVSVDSGVVNVSAQARKNLRSGTAPELYFKTATLDLNNIRFSYEKEDRLAFTTPLNIDANDFAFYDSHLHWNDLEVKAGTSTLNTPVANFAAGSLLIDQPGNIRIPQVKGSITSNTSKISLEADVLQVDVDIKTTDVNELAINNILLQKPRINLDFFKQGSDTLTPDIKTEKGKSLPPLRFASVVMEQPMFTINLKGDDSAGTRLQMLEGRLTMQDVYFNNDPATRLLTAAKVFYRAENNITSSIKGTTISPRELVVSLRNISVNPRKKEFNYLIDSVMLGGVKHQLIKNTDTIDMEIARLTAYDLNQGTMDSISVQQLLDSEHWQTNGVNTTYRNKNGIIRLWNLNVLHRQTASFYLDSFAINNRLNREEFWKTSPYELGYLTFSGGRISGHGINRKRLPGDTTWYYTIQQLHGDGVHIIAERDKTMPEDTIQYRPLLANQIQQIPLPFQLDTLLLSNSRVTVHEISKKLGLETNLTFGSLAARITNVKTIGLNENDSLYVRATTRMYDTGRLSLNFVQSYTDSLQGFVMQARLRQFDMRSMNELLIPLVGVQIRSGIIDSLSLAAKGNDLFAYGKMETRYDNLKLRFTDPTGKRSRLILNLINWVVNLVVHSDDNGRSNILFKERLRKRGVFNFWAKIGLEGVLSNVGVRRDRKERKQFKRTVDKLDLPNNYWEDLQ